MTVRRLQAFRSVKAIKAMRMTNTVRVTLTSSPQAAGPAAGDGHRSRRSTSCWRTTTNCRGRTPIRSGGRWRFDQSHHAHGASLGSIRLTRDRDHFRKLNLAIKGIAVGPIPAAPPIPRHPESRRTIRAYKATTCRDPGSLGCPGFFFVAVNMLFGRLQDLPVCVSCRPQRPNKSLSGASGGDKRHQSLLKFRCFD